MATDWLGPALGVLGAGIGTILAPGVGTAAGWQMGSSIGGAVGGDRGMGALSGGMFDSALPYAGEILGGAGGILGAMRGGGGTPRYVNALNKETLRNTKRERKLSQDLWNFYTKNYMDGKPADPK